MSHKNTLIPGFLRAPFVLTLLSIASHLFSTVNSTLLKIIHPTELKKYFNAVIDDKEVEGYIKPSMANFGIFNYGTTIKGRLHYPIKNTLGCEAFNYEHFVGEHLDSAEEQGLAPIIMVDRGECHFV